MPDITIYVDALRKRLISTELTRVHVARPFPLRTVEPPAETAIGRAVSAVGHLGKRIGLAAFAFPSGTLQHRIAELRRDFADRFPGPGEITAFRTRMASTGGHRRLPHRPGASRVAELLLGAALRGPAAIAILH